jgi:hypothetical protein
MGWTPHPRTAIHRADETGTSREVWGAGNVQCVIPSPAGALVGTHSGGVWIVEKNGSGMPVTDAISPPLLAVTCVAQGPFGIDHFYAFGANRQIYETDYQHGFPILNWRAIPQDPRSAVIGEVWGVCVSLEPPRLIAASDAGMFWADPPAVGAPIVWQLVAGLPASDFSDVVNAGRNRIAAAAFGNGSVAGVFMLGWDAGQKAVVPAPPHPSFAPALVASMRRTHLASSRKDGYQTIYMAAAGSDDKLAGLLRSDDGGDTFASVPSVPNMADSQANRNLGIGCSPNDPRTVAVGMRRGPWISTDAGANWQEHGDAGGGSGKSVHLHPDMYAAVFDGSDPTSQTLWVTSDGGVAWTEDLGKTWNSTTNRSLGDLEVNGAVHWGLAVSPVMWSYGTPEEEGVVLELDVGLVIPDLMAISTQDNGILGYQGQHLDGWVDVKEGGDGRSLGFLASGELVWGINDTDGFRVSVWNGLGFDPAQSLGSRPRAKFDRDPLITAVRDARFINAAKERLWAFSLEWVTKNRQQLWALWSPDGHSGWHWDAMGWPPTPRGPLHPLSMRSYSSMSSATGRTLYLADGAGIELFSVKTSSSTPLPVSSNLPPWDFVQVVSINDRRAIAIYNKNGSGYVVERAPKGGLRTTALANWVELKSTVRQRGRLQPLSPRWPELQRIEVDVASNPLRMWLATKGNDSHPSQVYETRDGAASWHELVGLPPIIASDLRLGPRLSDQEQYLYLATWGRSVFQTNVA